MGIGAPCSDCRPPVSEIITNTDVMLRVQGVSFRVCLYLGFPRFSGVEVPGECKCELIGLLS